MATELMKKNSFTIVGRLVNTDLSVRKSSRDQHEFITGTILVQSQLKNPFTNEDEVNEFEIRLTANALTQDKKPSKMFSSYEKLPELVGKKVQIDGSIEESRFYSVRDSRMVSTQRLVGRFVRGVVETTADVADFEIGGFLATELTEKKNKEGEIYRYDLVLAQANYKETSLNLLTLSVSPASRDILNGINSTYKLGDTMILKGKLNFTTSTVTVQDENSAFGEPAVKTYTNRISNYYITGGSNIIAADKGGYNVEVRNNLVSANKARDVEIEHDAKEAAAGNNALDNAAPAPQVTSRQTSLI